MSSDLILHADEQQYFRSKPANSKRVEATFGYLDYRRRFCQFENILRTNGIAMWRLNDVAVWLKAQPKEFVSKLFRTATTDTFRKQNLDMASERHLQTQQNKADYLTSALEVGRQKLAQQLAALNVEDLWHMFEVDLKLAALEHVARNDKVTMMKEQWKAWKQWTKKAGHKFPLRKQPGGKVDVVLKNWAD
eukprot:3936525-Rhodomonas_salina.1